MVYYFDVASLVVLAAFALAFLPRAIARWTSKADLGKGLILLLATRSSVTTWTLYTNGGRTMVQVGARLLAYGGLSVW